MLLVVPGAALALPTVKFRAESVLIPGFEHTGNITGAGMALRTDYEIDGTEYFGSPPPVVAIDLSLPAETIVQTGGFPTCDEALLRQKGPARCPAGSHAGPAGSATGYVTFGGERVEEATELFPFYSPNSSMTLFVFGHSPVNLELYAPAAYASLIDSFGYGPRLVTKLPLTTSVPGAPYVSFKSIDLETGTASKNGPETIYYERLPRLCHPGGFPFKAELVFDENGEMAKPQTVTVLYRLPCPKHALTFEEEAPPTLLPGSEGAITAPANSVCLSRRDFTIHVKRLPGLTYRQVSVYVNGRRVDVTRGRRISAPVDLRGLPKGLYTVRIAVLTTSGRQIVGTRSYHTCAARPLPGHQHLL
ncbi:MAG TPA: hypothetical protein VK765_00950 [Solirubrobacteraceae bacterium]|nr:hypothetical protein [Solirubrobacteraceae bacterium]